MSNEAWVWLAIIAATMLGVWRPRWLLTIICAALVIGTVGFFGIMFLILVGKIFGGSSKK